jgi:hypothetical protein
MSTGAQILVNEHAALDPERRFVWKWINSDAGCMVITMLKPVAQLALEMTYLAFDYTFKRVKGKVNEWRVAGMSPKYNQRECLCPSVYLTPYFIHISCRCHHHDDLVQPRKGRDICRNVRTLLDDL